MLPLALNMTPLQGPSPSCWVIQLTPVKPEAQIKTPTTVPGGHNVDNKKGASLQGSVQSYCLTNHPGTRVTQHTSKLPPNMLTKDTRSRVPPLVPSSVDIHEGTSAQRQVSSVDQ